MDATVRVPGVDDLDVGRGPVGVVDVVGGIIPCRGCGVGVWCRVVRVDDGCWCVWWCSAMSEQTDAIVVGVIAATGVGVGIAIGMLIAGLFGGGRR